MKKSYNVCLGTLVLVLGGVVLPGEADASASLTVTGGIAVAPVYPGASRYAVLPVTEVEGQAQSDVWGGFSLGIMKGARWELPLSSPFGVALLMAYDRGRDEKIRTLSGDDTTLRGMGDLGGALETGVELSYQLAPLKAYVKGLQAVRGREYGDEALGKTAHVDMGVEGEYPLSDALSLTGNVYVTWANSGEQRGYFGVTAQQASHTRFTAYRPGAGFNRMTVETELNYQLTPAMAVQAGGEVYRLTGDAADSPLVANTLEGMLFLSASYRF